MGTSNRQRRAKKAAQRAQARARARAGAAEHAPPRTAEEVARALAAGAYAVGVDDRYSLDVLLSLVVSADPRLVERECERLLLELVAATWSRGWQPVELLRQARRADTDVARLAAVLIAADHTRRPPQTLHPRWAGQLAALGLPTGIGTDGWLGPLNTGLGLDARQRAHLVMRAIRMLFELGTIAILIPPPGADHRDVEVAADIADDDPILVKVRALLAQAESTNFPAEAETFTAKAQELMARHSIDAARLWSSTRCGDRPISIRLPIDEPYADAKATLLHVVAKASRCRAVRLGRYGMSSVLGFAPDLAATELLFTSLLVQSATALNAESRTTDPGDRRRSRGFRSSFLLAYAYRIGERLDTVNASTIADADGDGSLLPVLAARDTAVDQLVEEMFGELVSGPARRVSDRLGWAQGRAAADVAQLNLVDIAPQSTAARLGPLSEARASLSG